MPSPPADRQTTLLNPVQVGGAGLFSARPATATLRPASAGTGIVFRRTDLPGSPTVPAHIDHAADRPRRTALAAGTAVVDTVEHCLSALYGMGIDNAIIDIDAEELPAGDGSGLPYVEAINRSGIIALDEPRRVVAITEPVTVSDGDASVTILPAQGARAEFIYFLDYGLSALIPPQMQACGLTPEEYEAQIAPARTFSTRAEAEAAREAGLFSHLTPADMLVIGDGGPIDNRYRFENEPARHKLLDLIGDLALCGFRIAGRIVAVRSGHALNRAAARAVAGACRADEAADRTPAQTPPAMDINGVLSLLPHRFPMVMVDRVLEMDPGRRAVGIKNVTVNEPFFQGHYPAAPIMPGVLIVEAMSQLAGLMLHGIVEHEGKIAALISIDGVRLRKAVTPGDQLRLEAEKIRASARFGEASCRAFVGPDLVAEAQIKFLMLDPGQTR